MIKIVAAMVFAYAVALSVFAQTSQPAPGDYITDGGWGDLSIWVDQAGKLNFKIDSIGANAHSCGLDGEIRNWRATLQSEGDDKPCIIDFKSTGGGIDVNPVTQEECHVYCGARAGFDAEYKKPAAGCTNAQRRISADAFKHLYDQKKYAEARVKVETVLTACDATLWWGEQGRLRNDLAITQYHLGDYVGCLKTLQPYAEDAEKSDEELQEDAAPADAELYLGIVKPARANIKLCKKKLSG